MNNNIMPVICVATLCILVVAAIAEILSQRRYERSKQVQETQETPEASEVVPQHVDINVTVLHVPAPSQDDRECVHPYDEYADAQFVLTSYAELLALQLREH